MEFTKGPPSKTSVKGFAGGRPLVKSRSAGYIVVIRENRSQVSVNANIHYVEIIFE